jgi:hypothetical protein
MQTRKFTTFAVAANVACVIMLPVSAGLAKQPSPESGKQMMTARWTDKAPQIDGIMGPGEWSAAIPVHVNFVKPTAPGVVSLGSQTPTNPDDLSFTVYTMYDASKLYVAVWVADDVLATAPNVWDGDAVELFIDGDRVNGCPPPNDPWADLLGLYDIWADCKPQTGLNDWLDWTKWDEFVASGFEDWTLWRICGEEGFQLITGYDGTAWNWTSPDALSLKWSTAARLHPRGYTVEWSVDLESIDTTDGPGDRPPGPGDVIGFDVAVDDNDGFGWETQGWWEARQTGWSYLHEDEWGLLFFKPPPKGKAQ